MLARQIIAEIFVKKDCHKKGHGDYPMKRISMLFGVAALCTVCSARAQSTMTLYGVLDNSIQYVHNNGGSNNSLSLQSSQMQPSVWGLKGSEDLGGGLSTLFTLESQIDLNNGALATDGLFNRQAYVGLKSDTYGTVTFGHQLDGLFDLLMPVQGNYFLEYFTSPGDVDLADGTLKINNAVKWLSPNWGGLQTALQYGFGNVAGALGSGQSYSAALNYSVGSLILAGGYFHADNGNERYSARGESSANGGFFSPVNRAYATASRYNIARAGAAYAAGPLTFGAYYSYVEYLADADSTFLNSERFNNASTFVAWQTTPEVTLEVGYNFMKSHGDSSATYHQVTFAADYALSKRTDLYFSAGYGHASGTNGEGPAQAVIADSYTSGGTSSQEIAIVGVRHRF
ncbi:porin [Paraburkholderia bannensis]|uniref:porin n=2 Tax=Paraburkholderia bannensis TaxID=765414 RepID=UPI002AB6DED5|nr:porin [Paraburkholderia bannensis]